MFLRALAACQAVTSIYVACSRRKPRRIIRGPTFDPADAEDLEIRDEGIRVAAQRCASTVDRLARVEDPAAVELPLEDDARQLEMVLQRLGGALRSEEHTSELQSPMY